MIVGFDTTVFPKLDYKRPEDFWKKIHYLRNFFSEHADKLEKVRQKALVMKQCYDDFDPFIEYYTSRVCPYCGTVCCANKFGFPEFADIITFLSLGLTIPAYNLNVDGEAICQFIGDKGCVLPRIQRPYRCTWYFCDPLMVQIDIGPAKKYRKFIKDVQDLSRTRGDIMREFFPLWEELGGDI
ncbi:MAG: hypothetical protein DSZ23_03835 [Thermodesulfatator sp.]|nr:MAG: hypothetical protein DSZ23_03835 [Thermodesulfatator sp.]